MLGIIGDVVQDIVVWTEEEVRPATDTQSQVSMRRGGSAANVAAFAAPRCPTRFIGCVGDDVPGHMVRDELTRLGVDAKLQQRDHTGSIVVIVDQDGERTMFPSRGASRLLESVDPSWLEGLGLLHITGYSLQTEPTASSVLEAARTVKEAGGRLSVDVSSTGMIELYGKDAFAELLIRLNPDFISANRDESALLGLIGSVGGPGPLLENLDGVLLARSGEEDTRIMQRGEELARVTVTPAATIRDSTGAGDAFNAGFLAAVLKDPRSEPDLVAATESAHALALRVLAHPGATEGKHNPARPHSR